MKEAEFIHYLDEKKQETLDESNRLAKEDRKDESNTLKAKSNIYEIFKVVWIATKKSIHEGEDLREQFLLKIENITAPWQKSLEIAKQHDDVAKIVIEEAKLSAVTEIKEQLHRIN